MRIDVQSRAPHDVTGLPPRQIVARDLVKTYQLGGSTIAALHGIISDFPERLQLVAKRNGLK